MTCAADGRENRTVGAATSTVVSASTTISAATAMSGEAAMLTATAMSGEAAMLTGSWVPVPKAVAPPTMIPVVLMIPVVITPATDPAVAVYVIAIARRSVTKGLRASGQAKTDADQQQ